MNQLEELYLIYVVHQQVTCGFVGQKIIFIDMRIQGNIKTIFIDFSILFTVYIHIIYDTNDM